MRGPEPHCQRQFGPVHHRASRDRRLTTASEAFVSVRPALQRCRASVTTGGANETLRPASLKQKRRAARLVWKTRLELAQRSCPCHLAPPRGRRARLAARLLYIIWASLGQRDKPRQPQTVRLRDCFEDFSVFIASRRMQFNLISYTAQESGIHKIFRLQIGRKDQQDIERE